MDALIGHTGFVGRNLALQHRFEATFNSSNIHEAPGNTFGLVVCAAPSATMWIANKEPEEDRARIDALLEQLERINVDRIVLISTIAVLDKPDAGYSESTARYETQKAYGRNRRALEMGIQAAFPRHHILRLPALFGPGLKKNFLFDILNPTPSFLTPAKFDEVVAKLDPAGADLIRSAYLFDKKLEIYAFERARLHGTPKGREIEDALFGIGFTAPNFVNPLSTYQYYGLDTLWADIETCIRNDIQTMHLATEPLPAGEIYATLTGKTLTDSGATTYHEDMRTEHAAAWCSQTSYIESRQHVLARLKRFFELEDRAA